MEQPTTNPFESPTASDVGDYQQPSERSIDWQHSAARALRWVPACIGYHFVVVLLQVLIQLLEKWYEETYMIDGVLTGILVLIFVVSFVYHTWFASLLYGFLRGILLGYLAVCPVIGAAALAVMVNRARQDLKQCGWQVKRFSAIPPSGQHN